MSAKAVPAGYAQAYRYAFEYPHRCLKLLGIGTIDGDDDLPTVENGLIFTNTNYPDGLPIRFVDDITDVTAMSPEFIMALAADIRARIALPVTQDQGKKKVATTEAAIEKSNASALGAQENKPIRRSTSRFRQARLSNPPHNINTSKA